MIEFGSVERPVDAGDGVVLVVPEVLMPLWWRRGVSVRKAEPVSMTPLERFALDLALTTGLAEPDEFHEITGLPGALLTIAARRLVNSRALTLVDGGYAPAFPAAETAAISQTVYGYRNVSLDIVLLPRTGDLLALDPTSSGLLGLEKLRPVAALRAPVPPSLIDVILAQYLSDRLHSGTVAGAGEDIIDVPQTTVDRSSPFPDGLCPAYRCRAELSLDNGAFVSTLVFSNDDDRSFRLQLPGASGLVKRWLTLADAIGDPATWVRAWATITGTDARSAPRVERTDAGRWVCLVSARSADLLAHRNLSLPVGLTVRDEDTVVEVTVTLRGIDADAKARIELDRALTAAAQPGADLSAILRSPAAVTRAWRLGFSALVYALRESEDFSYA